MNSGNVSITRLRATDDFAGPLFDARPPTGGDVAIYLHKEGRDSVEVEDADNNLGAYRVEPEGLKEVTVESVATGLTSLADYLVDYLTASARLVRECESDIEDDEGRERAASKFDAARRDAERTADAADQGEIGLARRALASVIDRLGRLIEFLTQDDGRFSAAVVDLLVSRAKTGKSTAQRARSDEGTETGTPMPTETAQ